MGKPLRACPICPNCGSKKFKRLEQEEELTLVRCNRCGIDMKI